VVPEAPLRQTEHGLVHEGDGWFVLNARDSMWRDRGPRGLLCDLEGDDEFPQLGMFVYVLGPGQPMAMYHWEADQEDFLVVAGEALLVVDGEQRALRTWDFFHCPPAVEHTILGADDGCVVVAVGVRDHAGSDDWGGYRPNDVAAKHGVSVEEETIEPQEAYAKFPPSRKTAYRDGSLPDL
jgi:quercetin dioxygenase-like cupin family protein